MLSEKFMNKDNLIFLVRRKFIYFFNKLTIKETENLSLIYLILTLSFYLLKINGNLLGSDYGNYLQGADSILKALPYSSYGDPNIPDNFRPPGYPLFIAFFKYLSQSHFNELIVIFQSIILLALFLIFLQILKIFSVYSKGTILTSAIFFSHPTLIHVTTQVQTDLLQSFLIGLFIFFIIKFSKNKKFIFLVIGILSISISVYFRPGFIYYIPVLTVVIGFLFRIKYGFYSFLIFLLVISPWIIRNKVVLNETRFSTLGDIVISYHAAETLRISESISIEEAHERIRLESKIPYDYSKIKNDKISSNRFKNYSINIIKENLFYYILANLRGYLRIFIIPHGIFSIKKNTTLDVNDFIIILKTKPRKLIDKINFYFIYLYILPYILNCFLIIGLAGFFIKCNKSLKENLRIFIVLLSIVFFGFVTPGPINKSQYAISYYLILVLFSIIFYSKFFKKIQSREEMLN